MAEFERRGARVVPNRPALERGVGDALTPGAEFIKRSFAIPSARGSHRDHYVGFPHDCPGAQLSPASRKLVASMKPQGPVALSAIASRSRSPANSWMFQRTSW